MATFDLIPHPEFPSVAVDAIAVTVDWSTPDRLTLRYMVSGALSLVLWPAPAHPEFTDELWRHSCFEAFVASSDAGYVELNASPSTRWAAYAFDGYREGMRRAIGIEVVGIDWSAAEGECLVDVALASELPTGAAALTAIIEAADGSKSYWALTHAPGPPDFHNPDCFIATLPAPGQP